MMDYNLSDRVIFIIDSNLIDREILNLIINVIFMIQIMMISIL